MDVNRAVAARWTAFLIAMIGSAATAQGQTQGLTLGARGDGYVLDGRAGWVLGQGYRPLRVELRSGKTTGEDREYTIFLESNDYVRRRSTSASERLVIPKGQRVGVTTFTVPQVDVWLNVTLKVEEGGRQLRRLNSYGSLGNYYYGSLPSLPSFVCIGATAIDSAVVNEALNIQQQFTNMPWANAPATVNGRQQYPSDWLARVALNELPSRWLDYMSADVIGVSVDNLKKLSTTSPETLDHLRDWTTAGGNLWIWGAGGNWERSGEIEELLRLWGSNAEDWSAPSPNDYGRGLDSAFSAGVSVNYGGATPTVEVIEDPAATALLKGNQKAPTAPFRLRRAQLGMVVAFGADQPFGGDPALAVTTDNLIWALNSVGANRMLAQRRQGASAFDDNPDFWSLMIPGVGRAPVTAFRVLITLFVVAIGPINYYWLRRRGKLHLLLGVVPLTALVVTIGLFGYAFLTDGLQTRVRARSFTSIDQARRHAVCWSRMTYYAGLSPSGGLVFDADTAVTPIVADNDRSARGDRSMFWEGDRQHLDSGWLYSRTPTQFLTIRTRTSNNGLRIVESAGAPAPQVTNALGTRILKLVLCDSQGRLYTSDEADRGAKLTLQATPGDAGLFEFTNLLNKNAPLEMPDMQLTNRSYGRARPVMFRPYGGYGASSLVRQQDGLLEESMTWVTDRLQSPVSLPPRNYIAIVERSPEVDFGLDSPQEVMPCHVIHGTW